ncbi:toll/interleukin-1 receptor domain-containing protein [uncultured Sphingomonas sp.]|uniref:toll/interleukin-1 receptor domain-containing protein n=1 Tax=uncultured Sphingomonas sp. TaxID=158754 RepID=UPI0035CC1568
MNEGSGQQRDTDYLAFISYAHRDGRGAQWAHRALETYRLPRGLAGPQGGRRLGRLFLDRSELATSGNLSDRIEEALAGSANLLIVCSPAARASRWVNEEVRRFRASGRGDRIFCLIVAGDPAREDDGGCFPPALIEAAPGAPRPEPLAADIRPGADRPADARLKLIAGLLDLPFDALRRREAARRQRLLAVVATVSIVLVAVMAALTTLALIARAEAIRQRDTAQRTATFLSDVFDKADPARSGGREPTLRRLVDEAATRALRSPELAREPEVKASLLTVLAGVYANLGLIRQGRRLVDTARALPSGDPQTRVMMLSTDVRLQLWESDYAGMRRTLADAFALLRAHPDLDLLYRRQLLAYRAQLGQGVGDTAAALRDYGELRRLSLAAMPPDRDKELLALLGQGVSLVDAGAIDRGAPLLRQVIAERVAMGQPLDPQVLTATNTLGAVAIKRGRPVEAEGWFRRAAALQTQVDGANSVEVALSRSNLGRALVEQRRFGAAIRELEAARAIFVAQAGEGVDTLANLDDSLGLARGGAGDAAGARAAFGHGLAVARKNAMPKEIELLADRAELACRSRDLPAGTADVAAARTALARFGLPEPWRAARIDSVAAGCLLAAGRPAEARPLIARSRDAVVARWGADTLFGRTVREQARQVGLPGAR